MFVWFGVFLFVASAGNDSVLVGSTPFIACCGCCLLSSTPPACKSLKTCGTIDVVERVVARELVNLPS